MSWRHNYAMKNESIGFDGFGEYISKLKKGSLRAGKNTQRMVSNIKVIKEKYVFILKKKMNQFGGLLSSVATSINYLPDTWFAFPLW